MQIDTKTEIMLYIYIDYRYINIYLYNIHTLFTYSSFLTIVSVEVKNSIY